MGRYHEVRELIGERYGCDPYVLWPDSQADIGKPVPYDVWSTALSTIVEVFDEPPVLENVSALAEASRATLPKGPAGIAVEILRRTEFGETLDATGWLTVGWLLWWWHLAVRVPPMTWSDPEGAAVILGTRSDSRAAVAVEARLWPSSQQDGQYSGRLGVEGSFEEWSPFGFDMNRAPGPRVHPTIEPGGEVPWTLRNVQGAAEHMAVGFFDGWIGWRDLDFRLIHPGGPVFVVEITLLDVVLEVMDFGFPPAGMPHGPTEGGSQHRTLSGRVLARNGRPMPTDRSLLVSDPAAVADLGAQGVSFTPEAAELVTALDTCEPDRALMRNRMRAVLARSRHRDVWRYFPYADDTHDQRFDQWARVQVEADAPLSSWTLPDPPAVLVRPDGWDNTLEMAAVAFGSYGDPWDHVAGSTADSILELVSTIDPDAREMLRAWTLLPPPRWEVTGYRRIDTRLRAVDVAVNVLAHPAVDRYVPETVAWFATAMLAALPISIAQASDPSTRLLANIHWEQPGEMIGDLITMTLAVLPAAEGVPPDRWADLCFEFLPTF